jgi:lipid-A-disaccharide synthase
MKKILIIAGEASSDMHAANLVKDINRLDNNTLFFGLGGEMMQGAGVKIYHNIVQFAFIGPGGLFKHYMQLRKIFYDLCARIKQDKPDIAILIDYAEFNLRVAGVLKKMGVPVIYYISPQIWAWGLWRIKTIHRLVDKVLVFFKFEEDLYKKYAVNVSFVGHPLIGTVYADTDKQVFKKSLGIQDDVIPVGVLPGSRKSEIENILPIMLESALTLSTKFNKNIQCIIPLASTIDRGSVEKIASRYKIKTIIIEGNTYNAINICACAMVASGTATLETALLGVPMAVIYKSNFLTYILTKKLIKLPYIGLVNIVAGRHLVPEFLQYDAIPEKIAAYINSLIEDKVLSDSLKHDLLEIKNLLGKPGASERAAGEVIEFIKKGDRFIF